MRDRDIAWVAPADVAQHVWNPKLFHVASFGHLPVFVDWIWIQTALDPSISRLPKGTHSPQYYRFDLITELDPANFHAYYAGATVLSVIRDDASGAISLLRKAEAFQGKELPAYSAEFRERFWSRRWFLHMVAGYIHLFELKDLPSAAESFRQAARLPGAPPYMIRLGNRLNEPGGEYDVGLRLLNFLISHSKEPAATEELERQRQSLFIAQHISELNRGFRRFLTQDPRYKADHELSAEEMQSYWKKFRRAENISLRDAWGGTLSLDPHGRIVTTTPYERVFGLD